MRYYNERALVLSEVVKDILIDLIVDLTIEALVRYKDSC